MASRRKEKKEKVDHYPEPENKYSRLMDKPERIYLIMVSQLLERSWNRTKRSYSRNKTRGYGARPQNITVDGIPQTSDYSEPYKCNFKFYIF